MKNLKIGKKLLIAFMVIIIGLAFIAFWGFVSIRTIADADQDMYNSHTKSLGLIDDITVTVFNLRLTATKITYQNATADGAASLQKAVADADAALQASFAEYQKTVFDQADQDHLDNLKNALENYKAELVNLSNLLKTGNAQKAELDAEVAAAGNVGAKLADVISQATQFNKDQAQATMESNQNLEHMSTLLMTIIAAAAGGVAVLLSVLVTRGITRPLKKIVNAADRLARGDTDINLDIHTKDEVGILAQSFDAMVASIKGLIADINMLSRAAVAEEFNTRADAGRHSGDFAKIVEGINQTLDTVVEKVFWYESLLDSIEFPVSVTDMDSRLTFINRAAEQMINEKRAGVVGQKCGAEAGSAGGNGMKNGKLQAYFDKHNLKYQVDASSLMNLKGGEAGRIEIIQDITARVHAAEYNAREVEKLANNLKLLKDGVLSLDFKVDEGDRYTVQERANFEEINSNFRVAVESISGYIGELSHVLGRFAEGDFSRGIINEYHGDFVTLKESINRIIVDLNDVFEEINTAAEQVAMGAMQVSNGNQMISQGATEQASAIEELSSTVAQIAKQAGLNAENASQSNGMALEAKQAAAQGNEDMNHMLLSMGEINESSENISKIIKVIDDIAFQTNILALNAAVEAARAGMHGKGFAVVAEEVRNLAARSAKAAKETAELIESSMHKVSEGTKTANATADALTRIFKSVDKTVKLGEMIAVASGEQTYSISQINQGIEQLSQVVQSNSATSQEGAASSEELSGQAELLKEKIGHFKLRRHAQGSPAPAHGRPLFGEPVFAGDEKY